MLEPVAKVEKGKLEIDATSGILSDIEKVNDDIEEEEKARSSHVEPITTPTSQDDQHQHAVVHAQQEEQHQHAGRPETGHDMEESTNDSGNDILEVGEGGSNDLHQ